MFTVGYNYFVIKNNRGRRLICSCHLLGCLLSPTRGIVSSLFDCMCCMRCMYLLLGARFTAKRPLYALPGHGTEASVIARTSFEDSLNAISSKMFSDLHPLLLFLLRLSMFSDSMHCHHHNYSVHQDSSNCSHFPGCTYSTDYRWCNLDLLGSCS